LTSGTGSDRVETISSGQTFFIKRVFPAFWFLFLVLFIGIDGFVGAGWKQPQFLMVPAIMVVFGAIMFRKLVWDLADEVRDGGDYLLVRRGRIEERLPLEDVMNVSMSQFTNPRRLTLRLRTPGKLGDEVTFIPKSPFQLNPFARNPVAEKLIARVDRLRNKT
jgi:hypothetical protein